MKKHAVLNTFYLVYCFFPKKIMKRGKDGYFRESGKARGILVKRVTNFNEIWYHKPEEYLRWRY